MNKSGARFDPDKTRWYNQHYLQEKTNTELASLFGEILVKKDVDIAGRQGEWIEKVVSLIKERAVFVADFWELSDYFFRAPETYNDKAVRKQWKDDTPAIMSQLVSVFQDIDSFSSPQIETITKAWIADQELSFGKVMPPLRLVIVGAMKGPHIFDILEMIGTEESISRIQKAIATL